MKSVSVKAKSGKGDSTKQFEENYEIPESIGEAVEHYGEEEVYNCWFQQLIIRLQASLRRPEGTGGRVGAVKKEIYEKMVAAGIDKDEAAVISGYTPPSE